MISVQRAPFILAYLITLTKTRKDSFFSCFMGSIPIDDKKIEDYKEVVNPVQ